MDVPQWVAVRSFMVSMQMMHCNVDSLTGLLACSFCAWMVAIRCCSRTLDRPASSSTSCEGISFFFFVDVFRSLMQVVEWKQRNKRKDSFVHLGNVVPTLRSISSMSYVRIFDWEASVFLLLAGFDGAEDVFLDIREGGCRR